MRNVTDQNNPLDSAVATSDSKSQENFSQKIPSQSAGASSAHDRHAFEADAVATGRVKVSGNVSVGIKAAVTTDVLRKQLPPLSRQFP